MQTFTFPERCPWHGPVSVLPSKMDVKGVTKRRYFTTVYSCP